MYIYIAILYQNSIQNLIRMIVLLTRRLNSSQLLNPEILVCRLCSYSLAAAKVLVFSRMCHDVSSVCNHHGLLCLLLLSLFLCFLLFPLLLLLTWTCLQRQAAAGPCSLCKSIRRFQIFQSLTESFRHLRYACVVLSSLGYSFYEGLIISSRGTNLSKHGTLFRSQVVSCRCHRFKRQAGRGTGIHWDTRGESWWERRDPWRHAWRHLWCKRGWRRSLDRCTLLCLFLSQHSLESWRKCCNLCFC